MTPGIGWGEDGDGGADVAVAGGVGQVIQTGLVDFFLGMKVASIDNIQFGPKKRPTQRTLFRQASRQP